MNKLLRFNKINRPSGGFSFQKESTFMMETFNGNFKLWFVILFFAAVTACQPNKTVEIQNGDMLFCSYQSGDLSDAINEVTQTQNKTNYSHMGLVEISDVDTFVIHASVKRGVIKEPLQVFLQIDNPATVAVYRIKNPSVSVISNALAFVNLKVGLPYNASYVMSDTCFYCSQLIYEAFKNTRVFTLEPMTFKEPETGMYNEGWIKYYRALGMEIPEGLPGCNPNGMAASEKVHLVGMLR